MLNLKNIYYLKRGDTIFECKIKKLVLPTSCIKIDNSEDIDCPLSLEFIKDCTIKPLVELEIPSINDNRNVVLLKDSSYFLYTSVEECAADEDTSYIGSIFLSLECSLKDVLSFDSDYEIKVDEPNTDYWSDIYLVGYKWDGFKAIPTREEGLINFLDRRVTKNTTVNLSYPSPEICRKNNKIKVIKFEY